MPKRARKSYTESQRQEILAAAQKDGLTALAVQKRFGVTPVTYYSWRKKLGLKGKRGRKPAAALASSGMDIGATVRSSVRSQVQAMLPRIVQEEVERYLVRAFGTSRGK